jgi:hypothetical protein
VPPKENRITRTVVISDPTEKIHGAVCLDKLDPNTPFCNNERHHHRYQNLGPQQAPRLKMSDLQRELTKAKISSSRGDSALGHDDWRVKRWQAARQAMADGTYKVAPPSRFPVILTQDGPVSSAEQLRQLAGMESLPETTETSQIEPDGTEIRKVLICDVSFEEAEKMRERAEVLTGMTDRIVVLFNGKQRYAMVVKGLNEGVTLTKGDETVEGDKTDEDT